MEIAKLLLTGVLAGVAAGFFGIGGGMIIVPALVYLLGFSQHKAIGTSLAILLPPFGLGAVMKYHREGNVDFHAAIVIGSLLALGAWAGSVYATKLNDTALKLAFGIFAIVMGAYTVWSALAKMRATS